MSREMPPTEGAHLAATLLLADANVGRVYGLWSDREWIEVRVTPTGLLRVRGPHKGRPAFAPDESATESER